jgi:hypothetical protein
MEPSQQDPIISASALGACLKQPCCVRPVHRLPLKQPGARPHRGRPGHVVEPDGTEDPLSNADDGLLPQPGQPAPQPSPLRRTPCTSPRTPRR